MQPFTPKEQDFFDTFVDYLLGKADRETVSWSTRRPAGRAGATVRPRSSPSRSATPTERSPISASRCREIFRTEDGEEFNLIEHRGNKVVLVVRGFGAKICPYCVAQTKAMAEEGAIKKIEQRNAAPRGGLPRHEERLRGLPEAYSC